MPVSFESSSQAARDGRDVSGCLTIATCAIALALGSVATASRQGADTLIRVQVVAADADPGQPMDREARERADSADDLRKALQGDPTRRELLELVEERDDADVVIEVVRREQQTMGRAGTPGNLGSRRLEPVAPTMHRVFLHLSVPAVDHDEDIEGQDGASWHGAAEDAAAIIEAWIKTNLDALRATRR